MSKITPKNLHYDSSLPPFLARLQANNSSRDGRHEYHAARPKKPKNADEVAEDEPVVFDEETGESLTRQEWEAMDAGEGKSKKEHEQGENRKDEAEEGIPTEEGKKLKESKEQIAEIGASKKRKAGKVVGGDEEDTAETTKLAKSGIAPSSKAEEKTSTKGKPAKKGKKIKLSFGDDE